ncbi:tetratricopeptide repeat protein [Formosa maritima]|uniref:Sel1 repeat family protein n=1 Tax=Formosa maritima TaxID=2592046 RepID=A0A5D0GKN6_9FLAO|nr:tetratricopeptide repeat protein [Formosa maritima]TYA58909.1 sel1 repeat family protein [Formosa maritima]
MKIKPFILRILLFSIGILIILACKEETQAQTNGIAHFEAGLKAVDADNMPQAFQEFLEAAKEGHIDSQFNVALMYEQGLGVSKNESEALFWYESSASRGNSGAQFNLGVLYENGIGTTINFAKANEWYRKASEQGDGLAIGNLGMLYIRGQGVQENKVAGIALLLTSAAMDTSPENHARNNITATRGLTTAMITEAQVLSDEMNRANNVLVPLDNYLNK